MTATFSSGTGPYTVSIDGGAFTAQVSPYTFNGLAAGSHTVDLKDANNCPATATINVGEPAAISLALSKTDALCNGTGDLSLAAIGAAPTCPSVTIPGGSACGGAIATLDDLVDCAFCVTEFKVDCMDRAQVPGLVTYPAECNP